MNVVYENSLNVHGEIKSMVRVFIIIVIIGHFP